MKLEKSLLLKLRRPLLRDSENSKKSNQRSDTG